MERRLLESIVMLSIAMIIAIVMSVICWIVIDEERTKEIGALVSLAIGCAIGLSSIFILRKRDPFSAPLGTTTDKFRRVSTAMSFLAIVPVSIALVSDLGFDVDVEDFTLLSGIVVFISMFIQAVFWRRVTDVGYMTFVSNLMLDLALILLNVGAILAINYGGPLMLLVSIIAMVVPIILMYEWEKTVDIATIGSIAAAVLATVAMFMGDSVSIGQLLVHWIPALIILMLRNRLKASYLVSDGERLF